MKFIIDENIGKKFAAGMKGFGEDVEFVADELHRQGASDTEILEHVGRNGHAFISHDKALRYKPAIQSLIKEYRVKSFYLSGKDLRGCKIIQSLVRAWPNIKEKASSHEGPFIWNITQSGKLDKNPRRL